MDLQDLYREVILDHNRSPRNFRRLSPCSHSAEGFNPLCGDKLKVYLDVRDGRLHDVSFEGSGCAISMASSSLMTEAVKGRSESEARELFGAVRNMLSGEASEEASLGKIAALAGVRQFPSRIKCANLAWHALRAALDGDDQAQTE